MSIKIGYMTIGYVQTNCYFVYDDEKKEAIVFDPAADGAGIYNALLKNDIKVAAIMLTHGHFDHILGVNELKEKADVKVYASELEKNVLASADLNVSNQTGRSCTISPDVLLKDGEVVEIAGIKIKMISTPGHTEGSACYLNEEEGLLIAGDTLFAGSCGRTDLPTGSGGMLDRSLKEKLMKLDDDIKVYPGHGESTTIGHERKYNPFC
ncbi:MAG: MBL fold metallo-hydrolase [Lachnospiraceae bacterium]|nr:MBL fold metallo-hydrolase [Lachnospiraceae bacterium]